jgi:Rod binding domain-containing protein
MSMTITPFIAGAAIPKPQAPGGTDGTDRLAARRAAEDFESFFLSRMMDEMFAGVKTDGPFGGGQGETMYRGLLNQEYGKVLAEAGGIGITDTVYREILRLQEGNANANA